MFWETSQGMNMTRAVLEQNPTINVCMWIWCSQLDYYGEDEVQAYLSAMTALEGEYPDVTLHPHYCGDEAGQTTYESCENKGAALWWLLALTAGWSG